MARPRFSGQGRHQVHVQVVPSSRRHAKPFDVPDGPEPSSHPLAKDGQRYAPRVRVRDLPVGNELVQACSACPKTWFRMDNVTEANALQIAPQWRNHGGHAIVTVPSESSLKPFPVRSRRQYGLREVRRNKEKQHYALPGLRTIWKRGEVTGQMRPLNTSAYEYESDHESE